MPRVIDIDDFIDLDRVVIKVAGEPYSLPGDLPVPEYLRLRRLFNQLVEPDETDEDFDADEAVSELHDQLLAMFQVHHPDMTALPFGTKGVVPAVYSFLNQGMGEHEEDPAPPTRRASTKTKTSGRRRSTTRTPSP